MKNILIGVTALLFTLSACAPSMDEPVNSETPSAPQPGGYAPSPSDLTLMRGEAYVDETTLLALESYPLQFTIVMAGSLPTPCHQLRVAVRAPDSENKILMDVYSVSASDAICVQVLEPFEVNIPLGSFPTGHYTVWVNGKQVSELDS